jgi:hypothetical protein
VSSAPLEGVEERFLLRADGGLDGLDRAVDRDGRRAQGAELTDEVAMARPVRFWASRATARAVNTMVRWASIASFVRTNMGYAEAAAARTSSVSPLIGGLARL